MKEGGPRQAFEWKQLQARAGLQLASGWDAYYIGLTFYALSTSPFSCLFFRSRYMSTILAAWGVLASLFEAVCAFAYLNDHRFGTVVSVNRYEMSPCEAESSGSCPASGPQIPRYFSPLGRSCGALSAVWVCQSEVDWSFYGSGQRGTKRLRPLHNDCGT
jgi:Domain of unknown function (DUF4386)